MLFGLAQALPSLGPGGFWAYLFVPAGCARNLRLLLPLLAIDLDSAAVKGVLIGTGHRVTPLLD
jgi:hypothetical protein